MAGKKTIPLIFLGLSIAIFFLAYFFLDIECTGWNIINPICQLGNLAMIVVKLTVMFIAALMFIISLVYLVFEGQARYIILFVIMLLAALVSWLTPIDPIPFIDEILTTVLTIWYGIRSMGVSSVKDVNKFDF